MGLDMLLKILRSLEGLAAELALVRLQGHVDSDVRGDVVPLDGRRAARVPLAGKVQVVGALAADMALADVLVEGLGARELLIARIPATGQVVLSRRGAWRSGVGDAGRGGAGGSGSRRG